MAVQQADCRILPVRKAEFHKLPVAATISLPFNASTSCGVKWVSVSSSPSCPMSPFPHDQVSMSPPRLLRSLNAQLFCHGKLSSLVRLFCRSRGTPLPCCRAPYPFCAVAICCSPFLLCGLPSCKPPFPFCGAPRPFCSLLVKASDQSSKGLPLDVSLASLVEGTTACNIQFCWLLLLSLSRPYMA